jgi:hypothetical protein
MRAPSLATTAVLCLFLIGLRVALERERIHSALDRLNYQPGGLLLRIASTNSPDGHAPRSR